MRKNSMTTKFIVPIVTSILVVLGVSGCLRYMSNSHDMKADLERKVTAFLEIGSLSMIDPIWNIRKDVIKDNGESLLKDKEIGSVEVLDGDGKALYSGAKTEGAYVKEHLLPPTKRDLIKDNQKIGTVAIRATDYFVRQRLSAGVLTSVVEILVMSLILSAIVFFISVRCSRPIVNMASILKDIAEGEGDLTKAIPVVGNDEIGEMAAFFNGFVEKLNGIVLSIRGYSTSISSGTEHLGRKMEQIDRAEKALVETSLGTSAAIEEMAGSISTIAENTAHVSANADETEELALDGKKSVLQTIDGINKVRSVLEEGAKDVRSLGDITDKIGNVAVVISDITDQTNLLALNAAIESARAGEHGRGFRRRGGRSEKARRKDGPIDQRDNTNDRHHTAGDRQSHPQNGAGEFGGCRRGRARRQHGRHSRKDRGQGRRAKTDGQHGGRFNQGAVDCHKRNIGADGQSVEER